MSGDQTPPLLPPGRSDWAGLAVALLVCVAGLGTSLGLAAVRAGLDLAPRMTGSATLTPHAGRLESPDAAAARAADLLARLPSVAEARVLEPADADSAIAAAIDGGTVPLDQTPRLVSVRLKGSADGAALIAALRADRLTAGLDDHGLWSGPVERWAIIGLGAMGAFKLAVLVLLAASAGWAGRGAVSKAAPRIDLLRRLGATDALIIQDIGGRLAVRLGLAGVVGALAAGTIAVGLSGPFSAWAPAALPLDLWDLCAVPPWPPIALLIVWLGARAGARAALRAWP